MCGLTDGVVWWRMAVMVVVVVTIVGPSPNRKQTQFLPSKAAAAATKAVAAKAWQVRPKNTRKRP